MVTAVTSAISRWQRYGGRAFLRRLVNAVSTRVVSGGALDIVWYPLEQATQTAPDWPGWSFRMLTPEDVAAAVDDPELGIGPEMAVRMRQEGDSCFGIFDGDRLVSYGWYAGRQIAPEPEGGVPYPFPGMRFPPDVVYMYKGFTHPAYRGRQLHSLGMDLALQELAKQGVRGLISTVYWTNDPSLRSCRRLGMTFLGRLYQAHAFGRCLTRIPPACSDLGVQFFHGDGSAGTLCGFSLVPLSALALPCDSNALSDSDAAPEGDIPSALMARSGREVQLVASALSTDAACGSHPSSI